jgi:hypothetical protein
LIARPFIFSIPDKTKKGDPRAAFLFWDFRAEAPNAQTAAVVPSPPARSGIMNSRQEMMAAVPDDGVGDHGADNGHDDSNHDL